MDPITIITYICACLGGILLFLCIILAGFLIASYCKKHVQYQGGYFHRNTAQNSQRYIIVSPEDHDLKEDGNVLLQRYDEFLENEHIDGSILTQGMPDNTSNSSPRKTSFRIVSELDLKKGALKKKPIQPSITKDTPPIQKKLFWKKRKQHNAQEESVNRPDEGELVKFTKDELNVPKEGRIYKRKSSSKQRELHRKRSQSEWNISDTSSLNSSRILGQIDENEAESLLPVPSLGLNKESAPKQSQYFDALETIDEGEDNEFPNDLRNENISDSDSSSTSSWETESLNSTTGETIEKKPLNRSLSNRSHTKRDAKLRLKLLLAREQLKGEDNIRKRVNAMKNLQLEVIALESKFYIDSADIESRVCQEKQEKIYDKRRKIIESTNSGCGGSITPEGFWIRSMLFCDTLKDIIQTHDIPILEFLKDIRISHLNPFSSNDAQRVGSISTFTSFSLHFEFDPNNGYFTNDVLTKEYTLQYGLTDANAFKSSFRNSSDLAHYDGVPKVVDCKGCKINWVKGKNATLRPVQKLHKETGKPVVKFAKRNSFFNFFTPPKVNTGHQKLPDDPKKILLMQAHYEIGLYFKETFVPKAPIFYLKSISSDKDHKENDTNTSVNEFSDLKDDLHSTLINNNDDLDTNSHNTDSKVDDNQNNKSEETLSKGKRRPHSYLLNEKAKDSENNQPKEEKSGSQMQCDEKAPFNGALLNKMDDDVEKLIIGRYRMTSSEGFDEFMKALGVGLMKRKLANSVTPVVVMEISDDGCYTIRTETTVRTTEIKFFIGKPFSEATIDGRVTETTPIRNANVITLDQKGNPSRKEKDTKMVREFVRSDDASSNGPFDLMLLTMQVDDVICKRVYTRIYDDLE